MKRLLCCSDKEIDDILYSIDATLANGFASPLTPRGEQVYSALREKLAQQKRHLTTREMKAIAAIATVLILSAIIAWVLVSPRVIYRYEMRRK